MSLRVKKTIGELAVLDNEPNAGVLPFIAQALLRLGYSSEYHMSYNMRENASFVLQYVPDINADDLPWLCNKIGKVFSKDSYTCVDNHRLCRPHQKSYYDAVRARGCCGFFDTQFTNPKTGNSFLFGFNHGH